MRVSQKGDRMETMPGKFLWMAYLSNIDDASEMVAPPPVRGWKIFRPAVRAHELGTASTSIQTTAIDR